MRPALVLLLALPPAHSAPAPADPDPRERLEALHKQLPAVLADWMKDHAPTQWTDADDGSITPEVRLCRLVGPRRAKAVIVFAYTDWHGKRYTRADVLLTVFLSYREGCWNTDRYEATADLSVADHPASYAFLLLAIDEAAGK